MPSAQWSRRPKIRNWCARRSPIAWFWPVFANAGQLQVIADLPAHQFPILGRRIQCELGIERLFHLNRAVTAAKHGAVKPLSVQRKAQD
jgi:hypothetical protein